MVRARAAHLRCTALRALQVQTSLSAFGDTKTLEFKHFHEQLLFESAEAALGAGKARKVRRVHRQ